MNILVKDCVPHVLEGSTHFTVYIFEEGPQVLCIYICTMVGAVHEASGGTEWWKRPRHCRIILWSVWRSRLEPRHNLKLKPVRRQSQVEGHSVWSLSISLTGYRWYKRIEHMPRLPLLDSVLAPPSARVQGLQTNIMSGTVIMYERHARTTFYSSCVWSGSVYACLEMRLSHVTRGMYSFVLKRYRIQACLFLKHIPLVRWLLSFSWEIILQSDLSHILSRDSISTELCHFTRFKSPGDRRGATVQIWITWLSWYERLDRNERLLYCMKQMSLKARVALSFRMSLVTFRLIRLTVCFVFQREFGKNSL